MPEEIVEKQSSEEAKEAEKAPEVREKKRLVGVRFSSAGKVYSFDASLEFYDIHELVVVEGDKGPIIGKVTVPPYELDADKVATNIRKVLKRAGAEEIDRYQKNREEAMSALKTCQKKMVEHGLQMKLVDVDILRGDTKAIFYFTAEERVDFRALVKDLATTMHMRIEMRQIGARDAAKSIGGIGSCGFRCCCETHLREFKSIAIQMAKNQGLSPNPSKLTGMCGKLKCCLNYENSLYTKSRQKLPTMGSEVSTPKGNGRVTNLDIPRKLVYVSLEESRDEIRLDYKEVTVLKKKERKKREKKTDQSGKTSRDDKGAKK